MKKDAIKIFVTIVTIVLVSLIFCGCTSTEVEDNKFDVDFESDIVDLLECNIEYKENKGDIIKEVTLSGVIQNKLDRIVNVKLTGLFYDKDDNYLGETSFWIEGLLEKDGLRDITTFEIIYKADNAKLVDHAKLSATEFEVN